VGFLGSILKIGAGVVGTVFGGPAGGIAAYTAVSKVTSSSPPVVNPPPIVTPVLPPPPNFNPTYLGGAGGGPVNSYTPPGKVSRPKTKIVYRTKAKPKAKAKKKKAKIKFGSAAYRKKYLGHKK